MEAHDYLSDRNELKRLVNDLQIELATFQKENVPKSQALKHLNRCETQWKSQVEEKNDVIRHLREEVLQYKKAISISTQAEEQLSDTNIQNKINDLFHAVRDWALEVVRRYKPGEYLSAALESSPNKSDGLLVLTTWDQSFHQWIKSWRGGYSIRFPYPGTLLPLERSMLSSPYLQTHW